MISVSFKSNLDGRHLRKMKPGIAVAARNSINKSGAIVRRKIADDMERIGGVPQLTALRKRVFFFPSKLHNLSASIVVLLVPIPEDDRPEPYNQPSFLSRPIRDISDFSSVEPLADAHLEELEYLLHGHFWKYLKSVAGF